jgi:putative PIN family toxin of toxin-antitoxin system
MVITVDTNVIFQGLCSNIGASNKILKLLSNNKIQLALSVPVFIEYCDVLKRKSTLSLTGLSENNIDAILDFLAYVGLEHRISFLYRPNLSDETDNKFIELSLASQSSFLVTSNVKHYVMNSDLRLYGVQVVTPGEFMRYWRDSNE